MLAPYFQCRPPDISSKDSLSVRLHVCLLQLSDQRGLAEKLTLSFVVQSAVKHIPWLHTFLPLGFVCLHDFRPVLVSQRPTGGNKARAWICQNGRLSQRRRVFKVGQMEDSNREDLRWFCG